MNIFLISSWYPSGKNSTAGGFIKNQAIAIGKYNPDTKVIISLWGDQGTKLSFENSAEVLPNLVNHFQDKPRQKQIAKQVIEFNQPALEWTARVLKGNIRSIIKANIDNFQKAQKRFSKIDIIHAHVSFPAGFVAMKLSEKFKIPYLVTEHMGPFPLSPFENNKKLMPLVIEPLKKANQVIAVSSFLQKELAKYNIQSILVPNLID